MNAIRDMIMRQHPAPIVQRSLGQTVQDAIEDILPHVSEFDAVLVGGDMHAVAIGASLAVALGKPLTMVCSRKHACVVEHAVIFDDVRATDRYLYLDDLFRLGETKRFVFAKVNAMAHPEGIVATYEACFRSYKTVKEPS